MADISIKDDRRSEQAGWFRLLLGRQFSLWLSGSTLANIGTWMQRIAQDWLVLTVLTQHDATAVGFVTALQFAPQVLLLPWTGYVIDHWDRRSTLIATQACIALLAVGLGVLTVSGLVETWHVYLFALALGCVTAFDGALRQVFISDMVGECALPKAVALNSLSFNTARLVGPALAGVLIDALGSGWVFFINAASVVPALVWLCFQRPAGHGPIGVVPDDTRAFSAGVRYVLSRSDLTTLFVMIMLFGMFGMNFPIFISTMATTTFKTGASGFGFLSSAMGIGSIAAGVACARRTRPSIELISIAAAVFGLAYIGGAVAPTYHVFALALFFVGAASQTVTTSTATLVQMSTEPALRGRVIALLMAVAFGGQPIGSPIVGWIANTAGPRWGVSIGAAAGLVTSAVGIHYLWRTRRNPRRRGEEVVHDDG